MTTATRADALLARQPVDMTPGQALAVLRELTARYARHYKAGDYPTASRCMAVADDVVDSLLEESDSRRTDEPD